MARMSKATRADLQRILADIERGLAFIDRDDVRVAVKVKPENALGHHFTRAPMTQAYREHAAPADDRTTADYALTTIAKDIGSDLAGLRMGRTRLREMLEGEA